MTTAVLVALALAAAVTVALVVAVRRHDRRCNAPIDITEYRARVAAQAALARLHDGGKP